MRTRLEIDGNEFVLMRDSISGELSFRINGNKGVLQSVASLNTHMVIQKELRYEFEIGNSIITVLHERPRMFAAFRNHTFTILKDDKILKIVKGR